MPMALDSQSVEIIGRNFLVSQLVADGLEVTRPERDRGVDLIAASPISTSTRQGGSLPVRSR